MSNDAPILSSGCPRGAIFVFGSNLAGRHGKGAALHARQHHGAIYGQGQGPQGQSYGIPTKDESLRTLPLAAIAAHVEAFILYARSHPETTFELTAIGCGLAGYKPSDIGPMFLGAPDNVVRPPEFAYDHAPETHGPVGAGYVVQA